MAQQGGVRLFPLLTPYQWVCYGELHVAGQKAGERLSLWKGCPSLDSAVDQQFERDKVCYEQNCAMFRSLNQIMWQVPLIAMTLTGGLWFGVSKIADERLFQIALLFLAAIGNFALCVVLWRVRYIMGEYLQQIRSFNPSAYVDAPGVGHFTKSKVVIWAFMVMLLTAGAISVGFAVYAPWLAGDEDGATASTQGQRPAEDRDSD